MKLGFFRVLRLGIALGMGMEIGRHIPEAIAQVAMDPETRARLRSQWQADLNDYEDSKRTIRIVPDETPTSGA